MPSIAEDFAAIAKAHREMYGQREAQEGADSVRTGSKCPKCLDAGWEYQLSVIVPGDQGAILIPGSGLIECRTCGNPHKKVRP